jgi:phosphatidylglycerol---prolipoprotein diacylglyceryl transferase
LQFLQPVLLQDTLSKTENILETRIRVIQSDYEAGKAEIHNKFTGVIMNSFTEWWQNLPSKMDPVFLNLGFFEVKYYGLMYLLAFLTTYFLVMYRLKREDRFHYDSDFVQNFLMYQVFGVMIGGRLGYVLFYNLNYYMMYPLEAVLPFSFGPEGMQFRGFAGMSFHGGLLGVITAGYIFSRVHKVSFWKLADLFVPAFPLGYTFGRMGNFINGELWGRPTDSAIGMHFPEAPGDFLRHPSQLYEGFTEGILLFLILWSLRKKKFPEGFMVPAFLLGYGFFRYTVEYFREPDAHLGFVFLNQSMGQMLSMTMLVGAAALFFYLYKKKLSVYTKAEEAGISFKPNDPSDKKKQNKKHQR